MLICIRRIGYFNVTTLTRCSGHAADFANDFRVQSIQNASRGRIFTTRGS